MKISPICLMVKFFYKYKFFILKEYKKNLYELLQKVIKEEKTFISNPQISERIGE